MITVEVLLILVWIGAVGLDTGSTLRFINRWGWKYESNYLPRKVLKRLVQTGKWRYEIAYTIFYISIYPLILLIWPRPSVLVFYGFPVIVFGAGLWNLFLVERFSKHLKRGAYHTIFGHKVTKIKTWKLPYTKRRIKKFDS